MLTKRQYQLIQCFSNDEILTSKQISSMLKCSSRTIRDEIKNINLSFSDPLIVACKSKGYQINTTHHEFSKILATSNTESEFTNIRNTQILKEILSHQSINYYDLADSFYISESTLDKIIAEFNTTIQKRFPSTQIQRKNNKIFVSDDEKTRRGIFSSFLLQEIHSFDFNIANYESFFNSYSIKSLTDYVQQFNHEHHLMLRDFEIFSFVLHVAIMMERITKKHELSACPNYITDKKAEYLTIQFYTGLLERFNIVFPENELRQLSLFFSEKISKITLENMTKHTQFIQRMIDDINNIYQVDLNSNQQFRNNLLVHLLGLESRILSKSFLTNPLIKDIKMHFPLLYDISVYVALNIQKEYKCILLEDEIGYLTLHFMTAIEHFQEKNSRKVILISSLGKAENNFMKQKLISCSNKIIINIEKSLSFFEASLCKDEDVDLIITTLPLSFIPKSPVYTCSKLLNDKDLEKITQTLLNEQTYSKNKIDHFFDERLFFHNLELTDEKEVIHFLSEKLKSYGYCNDDFEDKVLSRETIAPTTYGNLFAIPHPIEKCANKNIIAVASLKNTIQWQNQKTRLILLFALSPEVDANFDEIFERLVTLLNDIHIVKELIKQDNLDDFLSIFTKSN